MIPFAAAFLAARSAQRVDPPVYVIAPAIAGSAVVGVTLQASTGTWLGAPTGYAYQWLRGSSEIAGATGSSYTLTSADLGHPISVRVIASNAGGPSQPATSAATAAVQDGVPVNSGLPTIVGAAEVGNTLSSTTGSWSNSPTSYSRQWLRNGSVISGATGSSYTVTSADVGYTVSLRVTASNANGSSSATSSATGTVTYPAPVNVDLPYISGSAVVGSTLNVSNGTWQNSPTSYSRQWRRGSTNISGATGSSYTVTSADVGYTISCRVTATNAGGSTTVTATGGTVGNPVPVNTSPPSISGTVAVGSALTANRGSWSGSPTSYAYQWQRGTSNISGATGQTYTPTSADIGYTLRVRVTAVNAGGPGVATSAPTATVPQASSPPDIQQMPIIVGGTTVGSTLSLSSRGLWSGNPTSYRYQWNRWDRSAQKWVRDLSTSQSYTTTSADAGCDIVCVVWASNAAGEAGGYTSNIITIAGLPVNTGAPRITAGVLGDIRSSHHCSTGTWTGSPTSYAYQWEYSAVGSQDTWYQVPDATGSTWTPFFTGATNRAIRCRVTASNASGSTVVYSTQVGPPLTNISS